MRSFALLTAVLATPIAALWPIPRSLSTGSTPLVLSPAFDIHLSVSHPPADLQSAVARSKTFLRTDKLERLVVGRGNADRAAVQHAKQLSRLELSLAPGAQVHSVMQEATKPVGTRSEEYVLHVPTNGGPATLQANSTLGLLRGLATFEQLWYDLDGNGKTTYLLDAPISITDSPAFAYRGFMLDTARNYFPVSDIKRMLDVMVWAKLNQFHWHIVDSQSFPLQVPGFLEVSQKGAYSSSMIFTPQDVQDVINYAGQRGIDVMVEIDTPGHTAIIHESHPEHIACYLATPWVNFASDPPGGQLRFASPATVNFTANLLAAVAKLFPSKLFSTGGDELNVLCYQEDTETQQILNATGQTLEQTLNTFTKTTHGALEKLGKTPVVWEEMVLDHNLTLSNNTVALVWRSAVNAAAVADKGFQVIHAPSDYFYLDCGAGEWAGADPTANSWCDPFKSWQRAYVFDPLANITEDQQHLILGGQQLLWAEQSSPENLDPIVWPRAAVSAEVFWTGATLPDGSPRNVSLALPRLHDFRFRMVQRGIKAIMLQPLWCALRPGACDINA